MENTMTNVSSLENYSINAMTALVCYDFVNAVEEFRNCEGKHQKEYLIGRATKELVDAISTVDELTDNSKNDLRIMLGGMIELFARIEPQLSEETQEGMREMRTVRKHVLEEN